MCLERRYDKVLDPQREALVQRRRASFAGSLRDEGAPWSSYSREDDVDSSSSDVFATAPWCNGLLLLSDLCGVVCVLFVMERLCARY